MNDIFKSQPPRLFIDDSDYFLTFNTYKRKRVLCKNGIPLLLMRSFDFLVEKLSCSIDAFVIIPDHIHLLVNMKNSKSISDFLRRFKTFTSKEIKGKLRINDKYIWQRGTFDHVIEDEDEYYNHLDYIHYNPVKHEYVTKPEDWQWSSYRKFVKKKVYEIGWGWEEVIVKSKRKNYSWGE